MSDQGKNEKMVGELGPLASVINSLEPEVREKLMPTFKVLDAELRRRRVTLELVRSAIGQLRLDVKYMAFDLEATRQERDEYKARCESS